MKKNKFALLVGLLLLMVWQIGATLLHAPYLLPTPWQVCVKIWELKDSLFLVHLPATLGVAVLGVSVAVVAGVLLAVLMDQSSFWKRALYPLVVVSQTIPITAIAPLFILWFGYGISGKVAATALMTFFPITIAVYDGLQSTKREQKELLLTFGASKKDIFWKLQCPSALPNFFSALKMALPMGLIGASIAEWLGAQKGLGYFSKRMLTQLDGAGVFAPVVILSATAMITVAMVQRIEDFVIVWRKEL